MDTDSTSNTQRIDDIKKQIMLQERFFQFKPNDATGNNLMGRYYSDFAKVTLDPQDYRAAWNYLNNSIRLAPTNCLYLSDRASLHAFFKTLKKL